MRLIPLISILILITSHITGCVRETTDNSIKEEETLVDEPSILPNWVNEEYHGYVETKHKLIDFNKNILI